MSEPNRLHPITIVFSVIKNIKETIVPIFFYFIVFIVREDAKDQIQFEGFGPWVNFVPYLILILIFFIMVLSGIIKWYRYTFRIEDKELRIEYGLFVKKKRYIPFDRIQSLDFSEGILHRPFGLVKVKVETAGGDHQKSEAEMSAIKKEDALALRRLITESKNREKESEDIIETVGVTPKQSILYKISPKQLLFFASTSGRAGVVVLAVLGFGSQFDELIPFDKIFKEMEHIAKVGYTLIAILVAIGMFLAWLVSVFMAYLKYNDFTLEKVEGDLVITRGLLEKRTTTIPIKKVQAVTIQESLFRQPFGYASVSVEYAGGSILDENTEGLLIPVVKKKKIGQILEETLSDYTFDIDFIGAPKRAMRRFFFIKMFVAAILTILLSIWLWPYSLIAIFLVIAAWILGLLQYKSAGWNMTDTQLALRYRGLDQQTTYMRKNRMQSLNMSVNWFQRRADLATVETSVMSGGGAHFHVKHLNAEDVRMIYEWYRPAKKE
ncbi:PH domain-containing protein [Lederbergia wuyishanensis]|uniref:Membrane protein n=2 Tax=Lederbergia wuyishanensis TaxID=1347903 RepID=A0ABU0DA49_9BACI|nr:PH domain-containing protein [Lederbergia wuyishanensis]MDQ0345237.1 putative membrane protein [Lederbergia wuyishanensis]